MKLSIVFICVLGLTVTFGKTYSQNSRLTFKLESSSIEKVLNYIESNTEYSFMYDNKEVDVTRKVNINVDNKTIDEILGQLFNDNIEYKMVGKHIIINQLNGFNLQSQIIKVIGKITDTSGQPLPGVTVVVKGTTNGTITNFDGTYTLSDVPSNAVIQFSFVGMKMQEIPVEGRTSIDVELEEDAIGIEEVVAVGYGTLRKQDVTGSINVADLKAYEDVPVNNVFEMVKGTVSGLDVGATNSVGTVGGLNIRGQNTPTASNAPLVVVDGVIFSGSLADIQSNDVESFTVLKDASAAAVYGARSGNGVILIETKTGGGINGKPKFFVNASYGLSNQLKPLELFDANSYLQRVLDIREAYGSSHNPEDITSYLTAIERDNYLATPDHKPTFSNPYDIMSQTGYNTKLNFGVSQSYENTDYYISISLTDQEGVRVGDKYNNINGRINIKSELTDWFTFGVKSYYGRRDYSGVELSRYFQGTSPYASLYNEDGSYRQYPQDNTSFDNPYLRTPNVDNDIRNTLNGIITGIIKFPVKGLTYTVNFSNTINWNNAEQFFDENTYQGMSKNGFGSRAANGSHSYLIDQIVNYKRFFDDKHKVDLTLLYSKEQSKYKFLDGEAENFNNTMLLDFGLETGLIQRVNTGGSKSASTGKMARLSYTFSDKYALTCTVREDGFSAFSEGLKMATFYSIGANWNITKESFLQNSKTINNLAIRASYGKNGNPSVSPYSTLAQMSNSKYILGNEVVSTQNLSSLALSVFGWETTTAFNLGVDFDLLNHRVNGSLNAYKSKTNNLLFNRPLPSPSGTEYLKDNVGEIENKGIELDLNTLNMQRNDFRWESNFVFSLNRNKVVTITGEDNDGDGVEDDLISNGYFIGKPLGTIYNYKVIGIWQEGDDIINGVRPGDYKVEDIDGDGSITSDKDRQFLGNTNPNFRWSFTNTFTYKNWSLMAYLYSIWGGNDYYLSMNNTPYYDAYVCQEAYNGPVWNYWTPTNTDTPWPRINASDVYYKAIKPFDRSFIKLQKVAVSYNLSSLVRQYGIEDVNISLSADNLAVYAPHWYGLDPETNQGLRYGSVPSIRKYMLSLRLNF